MTQTEEREQEMPPRPPKFGGSGGPLTVALWRNRDYWLLAGGQAVSSVGTQVSELALPLLILALTHSPAQAGFLAAARGIPYVVLSLPAGALADRWNRRRTMVFCETGRALALLSIPLLALAGHLALWQLYAATLVEGTLFVFYQMTETVCMMRVVPKQHLGQATSLSQAIDASSGLIGPSLGGVLYGLGHAVPFFTNGITYLLSALSVFLIKTDLSAEERVGTANLWAEIGEGVRWLWQNKLVRFVALQTAALCIPGAGWALIVIVRAQGMGASPKQIGLLMAASGVGAIMGAALAVPLQKRFGFGRLLLGALWFLVLTWPLFALAPSLLWLGVFNALMFPAVPLYFATQYAWRLRQIPDALQGRVNSVFRLVAFGCTPLGLALTGWLLQAHGPKATVWLLFVPQVVLAIAAQANRQLREAR